MKVKLFQISPEEDRYNLLYMHYEFTMESRKALMSLCLMVN